MNMDSSFGKHIGGGIATLVAILAFTAFVATAACSGLIIYLIWTY